ncbi:MAG: coenzyme F420-0:L-glutamate ligase [Candidatus Bathyarchaeota archaeon]|nr:coenzyme F420-0:L-glutamate ligase [Candidatus Bathyarchaeota archaeon]
MHRYQALAVSTSYWKPNSNYLAQILRSLEGKIQDGDFVVVSEKALAVATGCIQDESRIKPNSNARFIAGFWMRRAWGYPLGILCGFGQRLLKRLRNYPSASGSRHKQATLEHAGLLQALLFGSEGGIDGSNLAYSYVSLPLKDAGGFAKKIQLHLQSQLGVNVCVVVADTDKTYRFRNFYFTPRPDPLIGIHSFGGVFSYVLGRMLRLKRSSTPLAVWGCKLSAGQALTITNIADRARGPGSGATVWDMAARFHVEVDQVSWEMLASVTHKPLVVVRRVVKS